MKALLQVLTSVKELRRAWNLSDCATLEPECSNLMRHPESCFSGEEFLSVCNRNDNADVCTIRIILFEMNVSEAIYFPYEVFIRYLTRELGFDTRQWAAFSVYERDTAYIYVNRSDAAGKNYDIHNLRFKIDQAIGAFSIEKGMEIFRESEMRKRR